MRTADQVAADQQLDDLPVEDPEERRAQECRDTLRQMLRGEYPADLRDALATEIRAEMGWEWVVLETTRYQLELHAQILGRVVAVLKQVA